MMLFKKRRDCYSACSLCHRNCLTNVKTGNRFMQAEAMGGLVSVSICWFGDSFVEGEMPLVFFLAFCCASMPLQLEKEMSSLFR